MQDAIKRYHARAGRWRRVLRWFGWIFLGRDYCPVCDRVTRWRRQMLKEESFSDVPYGQASTCTACQLEALEVFGLGMTLTPKPAYRRPVEMPGSVAALATPADPDQPPRQPADPVHFARAPHSPACGSDVANQRTTTVLAHATCLECRAIAGADMTTEQRLDRLEAALGDVQRDMGMMINFAPYPEHDFTRIPRYTGDPPVTPPVE
jgi:hypothetical protein